MEYTRGTQISSMPGWEIVRELGEGSYGKVFEVHKNNFDVTTKAALKLIRIPKSVSDIREALSEGMDEQSVTTYFEGIVKRFVKEIAVMSELKSHPNIVACEDYQVEPHADNIGWDILIRMELLTTLTNYQLKNPMDEETVRRLAIDICEALVFCQKKGLIHRDIKPANIFVDANGRFKLGDFGVARTAEKTMGGYSKQGTENYMAPEVYLGRPYGATVDLYSLGLVLYRLMNANRLPFYPAAPEPIDFSHRENALAARMRGERMSPPCNASEEFAAVILKACAYDSRNRYRTAAEMLEALKNLEKNSVIQTNEKEDDEPKGRFIRKYEKDEEGKWYDKEIWEPEEEDGSVGSIGVDFSKGKKTDGQTGGMDGQTEDSSAEADENSNVQDEDSIGSIGIRFEKTLFKEESVIPQDPAADEGKETEESATKKRFGQETDVPVSMTEARGIHWPLVGMAFCGYLLYLLVEGIFLFGNLGAGIRSVVTHETVFDFMSAVVLAMILYTGTRRNGKTTAAVMVGVFAAAFYGGCCYNYYTSGGVLFATLIAAEAMLVLPIMFGVGLIFKNKKKVYISTIVVYTIVHMLSLTVFLNYLIYRNNILSHGLSGFFRAISLEMLVSQTPYCALTIGVCIVSLILLSKMDQMQPEKKIHKKVLTGMAVAAVVLAFLGMTKGFSILPI